MQDGFYLTDNGEDRQADFADSTAIDRQKFAFTKTGEDSNGYWFAIVSGVDHYLVTCKK
jgi:hypothetical protein